MSANHDQIVTAGHAASPPPPAPADARPGSLLPVAGGARLEMLGFDLAAAFNESPLGIVIIDRDGRWQEVNPAWCDILGRPREGLLGRHFNDLTHPDDLAVGLEMFATLEGGARSVQAEKRYLAGDGRIVHVTESITARRDNEGRIVRHVAHIRDTTARVRAERELAESARLFRDVLENVDLAALNMDANGTITYCNPELCRLVGWPAEELLGRDWFETCVPPDDGEARALHGEGIATGRIERHHEGLVQTRDGARRTIRWSHTLVTNASGRPVGTTSIGEDITEKLAAQRALAHRATHDPLTGLANRTLMDERLGQAVADPRRPVAVIVCDLDGFKRINDRLGHAAGDAVLRAVAGRLRSICRAQDLVCRPSGDEFVIVITGDAGETTRRLRGTCTQVAARIERAVRQPVVVEGGRAQVGVSTGIAATAGSRLTAERLLRAADRAMYRVKDARPHRAR
jgi:diguanylate cyclase (GGDEF)-like protein/PAS domain S-box-containing protein